jgi:hypothetical protein
MSCLDDFRTARAVHVKPLADEETVGQRTRPMGTMGYMDLVFFMTGELIVELDAYVVGDAVLQLLTGLLDLVVLLFSCQRTTKHRKNDLPLLSSHHHRVVLVPGLRRQQVRGGVTG